MRRVKGLVFLLVLAAMVFGLATVAAAASFSDTAGTKYAAPVDALSALKIVDGYPDGTIKPDQTITRAEFAKIIDLELGFGAAVKQSPTKFPDVPESHWASGFINVAVGQGILKGYDDGTFRPDANVTYAEAITMLVRMLGYQPAMDESTWPASYLAKASQLGLTSGVSINASAEAKRGDVFTMAYNSLDADTMVQTGWGTELKWEESDNFGNSVLAKYLNLKRVGDETYPVTIEATKIMDTSLDKDQVRVKAVYSKQDPDNTDRRGDKHGSQTLLDGGDVETYDFLQGVDPSKMLGQEAELWLNKNDEIVYIKNLTKENDIFSDVVDEYDVAEFELTMKAKDKDYEVDKDAIIYWMGEQYDTEEFFETVRENRTGINPQLPIFGRSVKVVLNDSGKIGYIEGWKGNTGIIDEVRVDDETIKFFKTSDTKSTYDLSDNDNDYIVYKDGKLATLADLKPGDLFAAYPDATLSNPDDVVMIKAFSARVEGELETATVKKGGDIHDYYVTVGGKDYPIVGNVEEDGYGITAWATFSLDKNDTIEELTVDDLDDLVGETVTLYMVSGLVRHIETDAESADDDIFAVSKSAEMKLGDISIKVLKAGGTTVTYEGTDDTDWKWVDGGIDTKTEWEDLDGDVQQEIVDALNDNSTSYLLKFELTDTGKLDEIEILVNLADAAQELVPDQDELRIEVDGDNRVVADNAAFFDCTGDNLGDPDDTTWNNIQDTADMQEGKMLTGYAYYDEKEDEVRAVVITGDVAVSSTKYYGMVISKSKIKDDYRFKMIVEGEEKTYDTDSADVEALTGSNRGDESDSMSKITQGDIVAFTLNGDGEIDEIIELPMANVDRESDGFIYNVTDTNSSKKTIKIEQLGLTNAAEREVFLSTKSDSDEKCYVFDWSDTGKEPKLVELGDISTDDHVQIFWFDPEVKPDLETKVQFVKIVDDDWANEEEEVKTDAEYVAEAKAALSVPATTTSNLTLSTSSNSCTISWASSNTAVIATNGTVTQPTDADATVTLTATITKGTASDTKTFTVTVPKKAASVSYFNGTPTARNAGIMWIVEGKVNTAAGVTKVVATGGGKTGETTTFAADGSFSINVIMGSKPITVTPYVGADAKTAVTIE